MRTQLYLKYRIIPNEYFFMGYDELAAQYVQIQIFEFFAVVVCTFRINSNFVCNKSVLTFDTIKMR